MQVLPQIKRHNVMFGSMYVLAHVITCTHIQPFIKTRMPFIDLFKRHSDTQRYNFHSNMFAVVRTLTSFPFIY